MTRARMRGGATHRGGGPRREEPFGLTLPSTSSASSLPRGGAETPRPTRKRRARASDAARGAVRGHVLEHRRAVGFLAFMYGIIEQIPPDSARRHLIRARRSASPRWRSSGAVLLAGRPLSTDGAQSIDSSTRSVSGVIRRERVPPARSGPSGNLSVVYTTFTVFARALIVPSRARARRSRARSRSLR